MGSKDTVYSLALGNQRGKSALSLSGVFDSSEDMKPYPEDSQTEINLCTSPEEALSNSLPNQAGSVSLSTMFASIRSLEYDNSLTISGDTRSPLSISRGGFPPNFKVENKDDLNPVSFPRKNITVPAPDPKGDKSLFAASYGTSYTNLSECEVILNDGTKAKRKITLSTKSDFSV
ncbi:hypothetical protein DSO57_1028951 [Entomophthora muscae]|uniref:Uncharacterized protein n=1 Tax=Entomophthora muscae TaxID=34485 RepID=A0ACC2RG14_9FUNG|nr:hypothetical protein DSO57_1028951 [Entomophthora muscae]